MLSSLSLPLIFVVGSLSRSRAAVVPRTPAIVPIPYSDNVVHFTGKVPRQRTELWYQNNPDAIVILDGPQGASDYIADINVAGQEFKVVIDTGSSDLWVVGQNASCFGYNSSIPCDFGPATFDVNVTNITPFGVNATSIIGYGSGLLFADPYNGSVTFGNVTVPEAEFGVGNGFLDYPNDGISEGLFGLAYPSLTSLIDGQGNEVFYQPWFFKAVAEGRIEPYFAIALDRATLQQQNAMANLTGVGFVTLGGIPSQEMIPVTSKQVTVPVPKTQPDNSSLAPSYGYWAVNVSSWQFDGFKQETNGTDDFTLLDTGTNSVIAPQSIADAWNGHFKPPAVFNETAGQYMCDCNAKAPQLNVAIGGQDFSFTTSDLISQVAPGICASNVVPGANGTYILGDQFLVNVLVAFDTERNEVTIFERAPY